MSDITRKEKYYSAIISGGNVPEPITREEQYLAQMAQGGGGGSNYDFTMNATKGSGTAKDDDISDAIDLIVLNSTVADIVRKIQTDGELNIGGTFTSVIDGMPTTEGWTMRNSVRPNILTAEQANAYVGQTITNNPVAVIMIQTKTESMTTDNRSSCAFFTDLNGVDRVLNVATGNIH